jgi:hypothetical protein
MEKLTLDVPLLRRRAMQCRELADAVRDRQIGARLRLIALDYETMASDVEGRNKARSRPIDIAERIRHVKRQG